MKKQSIEDSKDHMLVTLTFAEALQNNRVSEQVAGELALKAYEQSPKEDFAEHVRLRLIEQMLSSGDPAWYVEKSLKHVGVTATMFPVTLKNTF